MREHYEGNVFSPMGCRSFLSTWKDEDGNYIEKGGGKVFRDVNEALMAYSSGAVSIHAPIKVRVSKDIGGRTVSKLIDCTVGRIIFNENIPQIWDMLTEQAPISSLIWRWISLLKRVSFPILLKDVFVSTVQRLLLKYLTE